MNYTTYFSIFLIKSPNTISIYLEIVFTLGNVVVMQRTLAMSV